MAKRVPSAERICVQCGATPITGNKFCSPACRINHLRAVTGRLTKVDRLALSASHQTHTCLHCGAQFQPKRKGRHTFCSRECSFGHKRRAPKPKEIRRCRKCGVPVAPRRRVCGQCRVVAAHVPIAQSHKPCVLCGAVIFGTAGKRYCGPCARKRGRDVYVAKHGKVKKHRDRARRYRVEYEPINPIDVFNRDGWRCQVCGCATPSKRRGSKARNAPELDHRVPMAKGGSHTWDNVQCACRSCNAFKGANIVIGQLPLFTKG